MVRNLLGSCAVAIVAAAGGASAATVTFEPVQASWVDATTVGGPTGALAGLGTTAISWGVPARGSSRSQYSFQSQNRIVTESSGSFLIGAFEHVNGTIFSTSQMAVAAALEIAVSGTIDGEAFSFRNLFSFTHFETPNAAVPCPAGPTGNCGDLVTIASLVSGPIIITQGSTTVTLLLDGFVTGPGGPVLSDFLTAENARRRLFLQASVAIDAQPPAPIPLPAGFWMLLGGIGALAAAGRARRG